MSKPETSRTASSRSSHSAPGTPVYIILFIYLFVYSFIYLFIIQCFVSILDPI